jgi:hypothetical protein
MTESEWLECGKPERMLACAEAGHLSPDNDPLRMVEFLRERISDRKFLLFAVAYDRRYLPFVDWVTPKQASDQVERFRRSLVFFERLAEGEATAEEEQPFLPPDTQFSACGHAINSVLSGVVMVSNGMAVKAARMEPTKDRRRRTRRTIEALRAERAAAEAAELTIQCQFLKCVAGNPFRPVTISPAILGWSGAMIRRLAQAIYEERAFDRLPILADALEEAGCDNNDILSHLRESGPHVRGCWVVDLLLGKS